LACWWYLVGQKDTAKHVMDYDSQKSDDL